ncbi:GNAT family N-acetyltransferase [Oceanitalea stevensii]|uniref:N-acetyltransferase n=1 Tax=Oceanitalea stevensii TaxID=2763072 RepID=A0ABR8Z0F5_9MICO|nr:GNAT family N-acetyltransferase [Oceanitalea stevensii]MBD8061775.1 N-acetyltransferase [Oceanitalea stevensii]
MPEITVNDVPARHRYEATAGEDLLGVAVYERDAEVLVLTHTVVEPSAEGQGVGSALASAALEAARAEGLRVVPECSFMAGWIDEHPEYADLVDERTD